MKKTNAIIMILLLVFAFSCSNKEVISTVSNSNKEAEKAERFLSEGKKLYEPLFPKFVTMPSLNLS